MALLVVGVITCRSNLGFESLYKDAVSKFHQGDFPGAYKLADDGNRAAERRNPAWAWRFRLLEAEILLWRGTPEPAASLLAPEPPAGVPSDVSIKRHILQGRALCLLGKRSQWADAFHEAESQIQESDMDLLADLAYARAKCAWPDRNVARAYYQRAADSAHGVDVFVEASALTGVGYVLLQLQQYDEAIDRFNRAFTIANSPLLKEKALGNLGYAYGQRGDFTRAIEYSKEAEKLASGLADLNHHEAWIQGDHEAWLIDLGKAHHALWDLAEAEKDYLGALAIAKQLQDKNGSAACYNNLTRLALRKGDTYQAKAYLALGEALQAESERLHFALDDAEITAANKQWADAERRLKGLERDAGNDVIVQALAQLDLGKLYWQEKETAKASKMFRSSIETAEAAVSRFKRDEDRLSFLDQVRFYDTYIRFLMAQGRPEAALQIAERSRAQTKGARQPIVMSIPTIQAFVKRGKQTLLAYWVTDEETYLWVIKASTFDHFVLAGHRTLHTEIDSFNRELKDHPEPAESRAAQKLYKALLEPAATLIPKGSSVVIVPSKVLSWVNFEALVVPGSQPHYWIDNADVQVAGSLAALSASTTWKRINPQRSRELLVIGDPIEVSHDFPALKDARDEMKRIEAHFPADQQTVISGKDASPRAYSSSGPVAYRFIHFDTHGDPSDLSPLDSAIILSPGAEGSYKLYAREIKDIPLHAELVTVSACYGAGSRWYNNEGVVGLGWAFLRAGAHQVVAGLWEADGAATAQLMDDFYSELTHGKSAAEALRDAKLKMLHSNTFYRHPYYWASLQLYTGS